MALSSAIFLAYIIINNFHILLAIESIFNLFATLLSEAWVLKTLAFALLAGSIIKLIEYSGGIEGFVDFMQHRLFLVKSQKSALMLSYVIGVIIFIESSITSLVAGAVGRSFLPKYKIASAKLAFVCDSTSAPISSLIAINGWGALLLGLISTQISSGVIDANATKLLVNALVYNFYSIAALVVTFLFIQYDFKLGAMKNVEFNELCSLQNGLKKASFWYMVLPIILMVVLVFVFLYISGNGKILEGSGSSAIFYTMLSTIVFMLFFYVGNKNMTLREFAIGAKDGFFSFIPITTILLLAFAIGQSTLDLGTGKYLSTLLKDGLPVFLVPCAIFLVASAISFSTGTSWGTFSIMMPIAIPLAVSSDANLVLSIAAVISGGVFGDHCSPISDTTIISAMASGCEVSEHVSTQLPYALLSGVVASILFIIFGLYL